MTIRLLHGDCREVLKTLPEASVHSIVTDPPYELGFMGKGWDRSGIACDLAVWREALRVLKPGGHLLAFSGTRTYHRMVCAIEDAGFEVRDQIGWVYGSGFPKSLDVSKAIDKARDDSAHGLAVGAWLKRQREARGFKQKDVAALWPSATGGLTGCVANWETLGKVPKWDQWLMLKQFIGFSDEMDAEVWRLNGRKGTPGNERPDREVSGSAANEVFRPTQCVINPGTPVLAAAHAWQGWGTALKPAWEPIVVARKPLIGTVAANVLAHGTGALNIDGCRVDGDEPRPLRVSDRRSGNEVYGDGLQGSKAAGTTVGRWPANLIHDGSDEVLAAFPQAPGQMAKASTSDTQRARQNTYGVMARGSNGQEPREDTGSAARFFYTAKADARDRSEGLHTVTRHGRNHHPTVKPTDLMRYLCRLVTPAGGTVLDPFMGSGSTLKAAELEGLSAIGIELDVEYVEIARRRIAADMPLFAEASA